MAQRNMMSTTSFGWGTGHINMPAAVQGLSSGSYSGGPWQQGREGGQRTLHISECRGGREWVRSTEQDVPGGGCEAGTPRGLGGWWRLGAQLGGRGSSVGSEAGGGTERQEEEALGLP
jgi:hypothetical protein